MPEHWSIDPDFLGHLFGASEYADQELERSLIESNGPRDKLKVAKFPDQKGDTVSVLLDGHRRYALCQKHNLPFSVEMLEFDSKEDAMSEMDSWQICRRNLTRNQDSLVRANLAASRGGGLRVASQVGSESDVTSRTVYRDLEFAEAVDNLSPRLQERAVKEFTQKDVKDLALLEPETQEAVVQEFDDGEFSSLRAALHGESHAEDAIEPKAKQKNKKKSNAPAPDSVKGMVAAAQKLLGKFADAVHDLNEASPSFPKKKTVELHVDRLSKLLASWNK